jgi:CMP-N-acetylneuraminic acid synthetase
MNVLALVAARGGSKRLPRKNIRNLGGKPLVVWSIDVVKDISEICDILVSTDDPDIADVCAARAALVPWLRPAELSTDIATSVDVALHALAWYEATKGPVDGLLLLQPTSPFRTKKTIERGLHLFEKFAGRPVIGVSQAHAHPMWALRMEGDHLVPFMSEHAFETRSQDLPPAYAVNGCFYLISPAELRARRSFLGRETVPLVVTSPQEALDIDTEWDWELAEAILARAECR